MYIYLYTCPLTTTSHREALQRSGEALPNIDGVNDIVSMLRNNPNLSAMDLRPSVENTFLSIPLLIPNLLSISE